MAGLFNQGQSCALVGADAWSDAQCFVRCVAYGGCENKFVLIVVQYGFGNSGLQYVVVAARRVHSHFARTAFKACFGCQYGCASHAILSCNNHGVAECPFVTKSRPRVQQGFHFLTLHDVLGSFEACDAIGCETDVDDVQLPHIFLIVGQQHGEFRKLEGYRVARFDNGGVGVECVVLAH